MQDEELRTRNFYNNDVSQYLHSRFQYGACPAERLDSQSKAKYCEDNSGTAEDFYLTYEECMSEFLLDSKENMIITFDQVKQYTDHINYKITPCDPQNSSIECQTE